MTDQDKILREIKREIARVDAEISALESKIENLIPDEQKHAEQRSIALLKWHDWAMTDSELQKERNAHMAFAVPLGEARFKLEKILVERRLLIERRDKLAKEAE